jgi:hypothetical protein
MIDLIFQVVKTIANKELRGNLTPTELNLLGTQAQNKIFRGYFTDIEKQQYKQNRGYGGIGYSNLPIKTREKIDIFSDTATLAFYVDRFILPSDLYYIKQRGILYGSTVVDEGQQSRSAFKQSSKTASSETFPQYHREGNNIIITPSTITSNVTCKYIRQPLAPKWTYETVLGSELFDNSASDFQDFELHPSEMDNIAMEMLSLVGINIRDLDVAKYAEAIKQTEDAKNQ